MPFKRSLLILRIGREMIKFMTKIAYNILNKTFESIGKIGYSKKAINTIRDTCSVETCEYYNKELGKCLGDKQEVIEKGCVTFKTVSDALVGTESP
jgi:hypothetical protein